MYNMSLIQFKDNKMRTLNNQINLRDLADFITKSDAKIKQIAKFVNPKWELDGNRYISIKESVEILQNFSCVKGNKILTKLKENG